MLELHFANAKATTQSDGELLFQAANGHTLHLGALRAKDAESRALDARFELAGGDRLRVVVVDSGASYPVTVDPLLSSTFDTTLQTSEDTGFFARRLAVGDLNGDGYADVVIGDPIYDVSEIAEGAAFVFNGGPSGIANGGPATANAVLRGLNPTTELGFFVTTCDLNGDGYADVAVTALDNTVSPTLSQVLVFPGGALGVQNGNPGTAQSVVQSSVGIGKTACAGDVNGDGYEDLILSTSESGVGNAYVFQGGPSGIPSGSLSGAVTHLTGASPDFGATSSAGDVNGDGYDDVIVGADDVSSFAGAAYIFEGSASGIASGPASSAATLLSGSSANLKLGLSVASAGDVNGDGYADVIVGSANGAFVFEGGPSGIASGGSSSAATTLQGNPADAFGVAVGAGDVNGDGYSDVVVGGNAFSMLGGEGAFWVFLGGPSGVASHAPQNFFAYAQLVGTVRGERLGTAVATGDVNGDGYADVISGGPSVVRGQALGQAVISLGGAGGLVNGGISVASSTILSGQAGAQLGYQVVDAGDLNGDGFDDIAVGAPYYDMGDPNEGIVLVFNGSGTGLPAALGPSSANAVIRGNQVGLLLGGAIAAAGDVNGDGYGDLLLGASGVGASSPGSGGEALLYLGSATGVPAAASPANASAEITSDLTGAGLGFAVAGIGDVNGDGFSDIAISAPLYDSANSGGAVFVFEGSLAGIGSGSTATASAKLVGGQPGILFGSSIAGAGDVNGDGFSDLTVGSAFYSDPETDEGAVLVFHGSATGISSGSLASANTKIESNVTGVLLGQDALASAGDFNGDGYDDLLIGSTTWVGPGSNKGEVFLYRGGASGIPSGSLANADATFQGADSGAGLGGAASNIGDVNSDGFPDLAFGAVGEPPGSPEGAVYVLLGNHPFAPSWTMLSGVTAGPPNKGPLFGFSVAGVDANGDGYSDLLVGAPTILVGAGSPGAAYLFYGNQLDPGRAVRLRQRRADTASAQLAPLGRAVTNGFSAEVTAWGPNGRGRVAATFQACPRGTPFGGVSCTSLTTPYSAVTASPPTALLTTTFSGLAANTLYHWRARLLYADATGVTPAFPSHGPWHTPGARAALEDVRTGADTDGDGVPDAVDNCPLVQNPGQQDTGGLGAGSPPDKIGDACQCGSVAGDGHVDASDVAAYRAALANPSGAPLTPAAQTRCRLLGRTGGCDVRQVTALRRAIASPSLAPIQSGPAAQFCVAALGS
ncbi:MAG TPA: FG-GAP-like repeat-containing protein [Myxococcota bacterium]|nr:FG-GAP-like repeat-containing protein [Myxococcota bacterium]